MTPNPPEPFDRTRLLMRPLNERHHDLTHDIVRPATEVECREPALAEVGQRIRKARDAGAAV
ncbi:MAG: hypothetical protein AAF492_25525, partial [Verrucomicrobiota bacterium]